MFSRGRSNLKSRTVQQEVVVQSPQVYLDQAMIDGLLSNTIVSLQNDVSTKEAEVATKTAEIASLQQTVTTKTAELAQANQSLTALQAQKDVVDADLVIAQNSVAQLTSDLATANAALIGAQSDLATANASLAQSQSDLSTANTNLQTANTNLQTANTNLQTANDTIADLQIQLQNQPAAGGGDVIMDYLNEDLSTWNYWDGDQNKVSYVWDAGNQVHNFTFAAGESSQLNYVGSTNTSSRVPVFYRPMTYADGSPVLNTDAFILQVQFDELEMAADKWSIYVGTMGDPQGVSKTTRQAFAVGFNANSDSGVVIGAMNNIIYNSGYQYSVSSWPEGKISGRGLMMTSGHNKHRMHASMSWNMFNNSSDLSHASQQISNATSSSSSYTFSSPDGTPLNLCIILGGIQSGTPQAGTIKTKIKWCVEKW
jgi:hypothetical protein